MRKFLIVLSVWLGLSAGVFAAETLTLANGASVSGDIVKFDDYGAMVLTPDDTTATYAWPKFSQDTLKQLATNPKIRPYVSPFINPTPAAKPKILVNPPQRLAMPAHPSLLGGMVHSSLGWFILLLIYAANLYAAFEVAVLRGKPIGMVMGLSAVLPIAGPVIFLSQPIQTAAPVEEPPAEAAPGEPAPAAPDPGAPQEEIQIVAASWHPSQEEAKPQPQVFARGKFTLNKRFIETRFAGFIGEPKGDAKNFTMQIKTLKDTIAVECIKQVGATEVILETPNGQVTVPFGDIMEFKLIPKPAA